MKKILLGCLLSVSNLVFAQTLNCQTSCSPECTRIAQTIIKNCSLPSSYEKVVIYGSWGCGGKILASVDTNFDCEIFKANKRDEAFSYQVGTKCVDITSRPTYRICHNFKAASNPFATIIYSRTNCEDRWLEAYVDTNSDCDIMKGTTGIISVDSASKSNTCKNLVPSAYGRGPTFLDYCRKAKAGGF